MTPLARSSTPGSGLEDEPDLRISVSSLARRLGVASSTLRTWERRYGIGASDHVSGSHRRYTSDDVERLECMQRALTDGAAPAEAARYALNLTATKPSDIDHSPAIEGNVNSVKQIAEQLESCPRIREMADAVRRKDAFTLQCRIEDSITERGVPDTWHSYLTPLMSWVASSPADIADGKETARILDHCISSAMAIAMIDAPVPSSRTRVVVTTVPGVSVDLRVRALGAALARESIDITLVPSRMSTSSLVAGIAALEPDIVVLWAPDASGPVLPLLRALRRRRAGLRIFVAGSGPTAPELPRSVDVVDGMDSAIHAVVGAVR